MNKLAKFSRVIKDILRFIKTEKPPKADLNLTGLNTLIQDSANQELLVIFTEAQEKLRSGLTAVVAKTAPGAVPEVQDDIEVMLTTIMQDPALLAKLNSAARKTGIQNAIAYLRAVLQNQP